MSDKPAFNTSVMARVVRDRIPLSEGLQFYGVHVNRVGFASCPFHGPEKYGSFKVYEKKWHCFGCHKFGDLIDFVAMDNGLQTAEAIEKINDDFHLGLPLKGKLSRSERVEIERKAKELADKRKAEKARFEAIQKGYDDAFDEWARWDFMKWLYEPIEPNDSDLDKYAEACWQLPVALDRLERARDELFQYRRGQDGTGNI